MRPKQCWNTNQGFFIAIAYYEPDLLIVDSEAKLNSESLSRGQVTDKKIINNAISRCYEN
jgi:hypothetical protein